MQGHLPHPATPVSDAAAFLAAKRGKKRGSYNCGRCGLPKKGHNCPFAVAAAADGDFPATPSPVGSTAGAECSTITTLGSGTLAAATPSSVVRPQTPAIRRRALSFDDIAAAESVGDLCEDGFDLEEGDMDLDLDLDLDLDADGSGGLPPICLWEVLKRLPPSGLLYAAGVCRRWRDMTRKVWRSAEELRVRVPAKAPIGFVGSVLQKCPGLLKLSLRVESDVDSTMLACIAFSCPNLQSLEIFTADSSINRISGDELNRFIADKRCLTNLKMEGCSNLGGFVFSSFSLSSLWLSDLHSLSKMVFNCPNLKEISLDFSHKENDDTDLTAAVVSLGRSCSKLQNIHIASPQLSHDTVLALSAANLSELRMLSLVLGSGITDASVAAITSSFSKLELLDLSGSSTSDNGIGMICNVFPETLTKFLLALCPNITSSGIQFAAAQLPRLELLDCGMTICDPNSEKSNEGTELPKTPNTKLRLMCQKLIIKHDRLKKLSLWGCSGLDELYLNCPNLNDLNLNYCGNLHPERLVLQCPNLETVHASDCGDMLIEAVETQVCNGFSAEEDHSPSKHLSNGSKRVWAPSSCSPQPSDDKKWSRPEKRRRLALVIS